MTENIHETSKVTLKGRLAQGKAKSDKGEFVVYHDRVEVKRLPATLSIQPPTGAEKWAEAIYDVPLVPDDKDSYALSWELMADSTEVTPGSDDWIVWPLKGTIEAVQHEDTAKKAIGARLRIMQNGKPTPWDSTINYATKDPGGDVEVRLEKGYPYLVEAVAPWEIRKVTPSPEKGRKRRVEVVRNFEAEIISPLPGPDATRQYVNGTTADAGRDGLGSKVKIKVGAKGDSALPDAEKVGKAGVFVFIEVAFSGPAGTKSNRDLPPTNLIAGNDLAVRTEVTAKVSYKGKIELKGPKGTGEFEIELGLAGGDTCIVKAGSTAACDQAKLEFVNWRKLSYEPLFPDFMAGGLDGVTGGHDLPLALRNIFAGYLQPCFIEYVRQASKAYVSGSALKGAVAAAFLERTDGRNLYLFAEGWKNEIAETEFTTTADKKCMKMRLCDGAYGSDVADKTHNPTLKAKVTHFPVGSYYLPRHPGTGALTPINVAGYKWKYDIPAPAEYIKHTVLEWETPNAPDITGAVPGTITVIEILHQPAAVSVAFTGTAVVVEPGEKTKVENFLKALLVGNIPALRKQGNKIKLKITGEAGAAIHESRFAAVKSLLEQLFNTHKTEVPVHPGLNDQGVPLEGDVDLAWLTHKSISKVTIELPVRAATTDPYLPGDLVGDLSPTKAPIKLTFKMVQTTGAINGSAVGDKQTMVIRPGDVNGGAQTVCHELGHSMGMTITRAMTSPLWLKKEPHGMPDAKHVDSGGTYYVTAKDAAETGGRRKIHQGSHCAAGLEAIYSGPAAAWTISGTCIMWGAGAATRTAFCPQCIDYIRARNLKDIQNKWDNRGADEDY